ncbi:hypothetical protein [Nocardiopsis lambiniae]|uniref:Uncharacterized protein n=1 Tax=Nocardiopsis lambiniae TaxID=3075539 RepID=A0ABU2MCF2_9ACTN|nr:hypothetical protein [Nocardiopsis sp. DSM 44743]MDT0330363.1 hypothetical protein [Nocardiopsis sp. DSM 44743]
MSPHTSGTTAPRDHAPTTPTAPRDPTPPTPQDLVPHLRGLARSLRERAAAERRPS